MKSSLLKIDLQSLQCFRGFEGESTPIFVDISAYRVYGVSSDSLDAPELIDFLPESFSEMYAF